MESPAWKSVRGYKGDDSALSAQTERSGGVEAGVG
jgi:hypothetical protein